ncbi:MAG: ABC transporter permease [Atopobiaceae bacterium]|nr:ABC transporter permease [Atopobiaceae bacterium]
MLGSIVEIVQDKWEWRSHVVRLSRFELLKRSRNSALSWAWLIIRPLVTIFCYWFALYVGFRHGQDMVEGMPPYILWLVSGVVPWFFMNEILHGGTDLMRSYSYLVTKVRFPLAAIPSIYVVTSFIIQLILQAGLAVVYFASGQALHIHLVQIPFLLVLMFAFWDLCALLFSLLSTANRGVANSIKALGTPIFWLSGVLFDVDGIAIPWLNRLLHLNPVTFFVTGFRQAIYYHTWIWEDRWVLVGFAAVFALLLVLTALAYRWLAREVPDVL